MLETRIDTIDFGARVPYVWLALACAAYGALGFLLYLDTQNTIKYNSPVSAGFWVERAGIALFMLLVFAPLVVFLLLPLRLRFTEAGILRRTVLRPRFVPWQTVRGARLSSYKGGVWLELKVDGRRTWIVVPVSEYRRRATLLAEIRRRVGVEIEDPGGQLASRLKDD